MFENVSLAFFYGGSFKKHKGHITYMEGETKECQGLDIDKVCYFDILDTAKDFGYEDGVIMYYLVPEMNLTEGLRIIVDDNSSNDMVKYLQQWGRVEIYLSEVAVDDVVSSSSEGNDVEIINGDEGSDGGESESSMEDVMVDENIAEPSCVRERAGEEVNDEEDHSSAIESEYYESSELGSFYTSSDDSEAEHAVRKRSIYPSYNDKCEFELGMKFAGPKEFKDAITAYSVASKRELYYAKNDKRLLRVKCVAKNCPWTIFASIETKSGSLQVKTFHNEHKCNSCFRNKRVTSKFMAKHFRERICAFPSMKLVQLQRFCKNELKVEVTLNQCRRAKQLVLTDIGGCYKKDFSRLWDYAEELRNTNKGSTVCISVQRQSPDAEPVFQRIYVCLEACKQGWLVGCRPIIGLDGCFLKGFCKGELLAAIGRDGNNQMYPIAWAVVEVENKSSWKWFLDLLMKDLGYVDAMGLTIISDKQKGLVYAISEMLPHVEHRMCARHVYANWSKDHRGSQLKILFWMCAKSRTVAGFENYMKQVQEISAKAYDDLMKTCPQHWCKAYFRSWPKCDIVDNNLSETFNGWIMEARCKSIISMLEDIRIAIMRRLQRKKVAANQWHGILGPRIVKILNNNKEESFKCDVEWNGSGGYEVSYRDERYAVQLRSKTCSCKEWELTGIPCPHAICAINHKGDEVEDYVDTWYKKETYLKSYALAIEPMKGPMEWIKTGLQPMLPPPMRVMPGRPKKNRRKDPLETKKVGNLSRKGRIMTCSFCGGKGHNKSTCKNQKGNVRECREGTEHDKNKGNEKKTAERPCKGKQKSDWGNVQDSREGPKQCKIKEKKTDRTSWRLQGYGLYINEQTGVKVLNPGSNNSRLISTENKRKRVGSGRINEDGSMVSECCVRSTQGSVNQ